jgi:hypothetical protein
VKPRHNKENKMNMGTTTTVQRDDAAECRAAFEKRFVKVPDGLLTAKEVDLIWISWQAAWKAARGE